MTLDEKFDAYIRARGLNPLVTDLSMFREPFLAGAAAMAELFASGQGVRLEQAPRRYRVYYRPVVKDSESQLIRKYGDTVSQVLWAYSIGEIEWQLVDGHLGKPMIIDVRPADDSTKDTA